MISCNVDVPLNSFTDIPDRLVNVEYLIKLLDHVDRSVVCSGIKCNDKLHELAKSGGRNGIFKDSRGEIKAKYNGDVIRPVNCNGLFSEGSACEHCKCYKKILMTMLSNKSKKLSSVIRKTNVNSHCPWKYLNSEEVELRVKNCRHEREKLAWKLSQLEEKFQQVSYLDMLQPWTIVEAKTKHKCISQFLA